MIDPQKVRAFWEARGEHCAGLPFESIGNLEESAELLALKIKLEAECVLPRLCLDQSMSLLDLGAGCGQWSFRFSSAVGKVVAVEYSGAMHDIGAAEAARRGVDNVEFIHCAAEDFIRDEQFDVVFISGLFVYLTDAQAEEVLRNLPNMVKKDGIVFLRDGTSILGKRHHIDNRFSELLKTQYSAFYRTGQEYIGLFRQAGLIHVEDGQVFPEGCVLNKYPETRLRYYLFRKS